MTKQAARAFCAKQMLGKPNELKPFDVMQGFQEYRLGDCIKRCSDCRNEYNRKLRNCMALEYYRRACGQSNPNYRGAYVQEGVERTPPRSDLDERARAEPPGAQRKKSASPSQHGPLRESHVQPDKLPA